MTAKERRPAAAETGGPLIRRALGRLAGAMGRARKARSRPLIGFVVGLLLLAAVGVAILTNPDELREAWGHLRAAPAWLIGLFVLLPLLNLISVTIGFQALTGRFGRVGRGEMLALLGSSWLLNYLPLRPGLVGRVAYHKRVNGIAVKHSAWILAWSTALSVVSGGMLLLAAAPLAGGAAGRNEGWLWAASWLTLPLGLSLLAAVILRGMGLDAWRTAVALAAKYADMAIWAARYVLAFRLIGEPIAAKEASLIAALSQATLLVPLTGNGLGLRETVVAGLSRSMGTELVDGALADVLNRAVEVAVAVPVGLLATAWLARAGRVTPAEADVTRTEADAAGAAVRTDANPGRTAP